MVVVELMYDKSSRAASLTISLDSTSLQLTTVSSSPFRHIRFVSFCLFSFGHLFYLYIFSLKSLVHTCNLTQFFPLTIEKFIR